MQTLTRADGTVVGFGSINHAELARLQAAAKKRASKDESKVKDEPEVEAEDDLVDEPEPVKPAPAPVGKSTAKP